jgi:hypothetical protein
MGCQKMIKKLFKAVELVAPSRISWTLWSNDETGQWYQIRKGRDQAMSI